MDTPIDEDFSGDTRVFSGRESRPSFTDSQTATRMPKPSQEKTGSSFLSKVFGQRQALASKEKDEQAELDAKRARVRVVADELNIKIADVEKAQARLNRADGEFATLTARRVAAETEAKEVWGQPDMAYTGPVQVDRLYLVFAGLDAAIADFPEARKRLVKAVEEAQARLAEFKTQNDLVD